MKVLMVLLVFLTQQPEPQFPAAPDDLVASPNGAGTNALLVMVTPTFLSMNAYAFGVGGLPSEAYTIVSASVSSDVGVIQVGVDAGGVPVCAYTGVNFADDFSSSGYAAPCTEGVLASPLATLTVNQGVFTQ